VLLLLLLCTGFPKKIKHILDGYAKLFCVLIVTYLLKEHSANSCGIENRQKLMTLVVPLTRVLPERLEKAGWPVLTV
jgi:hypothetical protein